MGSAKSAVTTEGRPAETRLVRDTRSHTVTGGPHELEAVMMSTRMGIPQAFEFEGRQVAVLLQSFCATHGNDRGFDFRGIVLEAVNGKRISTASALRRKSLNGEKVLGRGFAGVYNPDSNDGDEENHGEIRWALDQPKEVIWGEEAVPG